MPQRLWWWKKRLSASVQASITAPAFLPVTLRAPEREVAAAVITLSEQVRVELRSLDGASAAWVAQLVRALGEAS